MRANEFIRELLDLIDRADASEVQEVQPEGDDPNRFKQIADLATEPAEVPMYSNQPNEQYAGPDSVTTQAGGGVNGPKHAADLRGNSFRIYPGDRN